MNETKSGSSAIDISMIACLSFGVHVNASIFAISILFETILKRHHCFYKKI